MAQQADGQADAYDLVVLGAGSTAFAAALRATELGKRVLLTEERIIGGTCANRGCLPSKHLIEAARLLHDARHPRYPAIGACQPTVNFASLIARKDELVEGYRESKYITVAAESAGIEIAKGHATFVSEHTIQVDGRIIHSDRFLVATGSRPIIPDIEGLESTPYITSDLLSAGEAMELTEAPTSLIILGGGYIALELGQMFARFGAAVTLIEPGPRVLWRDAEPEVGLAIQGILRDEGITILTRAQVQRTQVANDGVAVTVTSRGATYDLGAARLLIAAGRRPNSDQLGLDRVGIRSAPDGSIVVDEYLRTSAPHVWAAGDVIGAEVGSQQATPVGARDGAIAAHNALSREAPRRVDHRVIPRAIFTEPQIATVGLTDAQAKQHGRRCWCNTVPLDYVPRASATLDTRGLVKLVADAETREVLGASMVGANAAEVIHEAAMALRFRATLDDLIDQLHIYPTMAEALRIAAISYYKDPATLSCCAD